MPDILPILLALTPVLSKTTCHQLSRIIPAMLAMTGRITQLGISRWTGEGGSYRTVHRLFHTSIDWLEVQWLFFRLFVDHQNGDYIMAGDETPVGKAGKQTYGIGRFFSSVLGKAIPGLAFFSIALIDVRKRQAYSLSTEQVIRTPEEKEQTRQRKERRKLRSKRKDPARKVGRPKGSKNKNKADVTLSPELLRILAQTQKVLALIGDKIRVAYFVLDGHFGNHLACFMVRQMGLHLISKMHHNAQLYLEPTAQEKTERPRLKYGARIDYAHLPETLCCSSVPEDGYRTEMYQACCLHKDYADRINVVIIVRTDLQTQRVGHIVLFSSDLALDAETLVDYYALRFQIEFTFRDAKQYFGLEDFMSVKETSVANAVGLSFFMVNLSTYLLGHLRTSFPGSGVNDLKSYYRGRHYVAEILKLLPEKPDGITCSRLIAQVSSLGFIHPMARSDADLDLAA
jgi:putative transposase